MINLKKKQDCCGCTACMNICPQHCIIMQEDNEGFLYPKTNMDSCIQCNLCNRVCPVLNTERNLVRTYSKSTKAYAAAIKDTKTLLQSSSGGIFSAIATNVIHKRGVVYGAAWGHDEVRHIRIENLEDLSFLRGSKYVQSVLGEAFLEIRKLLQSGKKVLFTGTPCQLAGLHAFLRKEYKNLLTIEIACHGVPSPKVLRKYMQVLRKQYNEDIQLNFRSKPNGWLDYKVTAYNGNVHYFYEGQKENIFMKGFLRELYSRPICHECPFKAGKSGADITLGDFWGIDKILPSFPLYGGVSLVLIHTTKAEAVLKTLKGVKSEAVDLYEAIKYNGALLHNELPHPERQYFFKRLDRKPFVFLVEQCLKMRLFTRIKLRIQSYRQKLRI